MMMMQDSQRELCGLLVWESREYLKTGQDTAAARCVHDYFFAAFTTGFIPNEFFAEEGDLRL